jgi:hypothetical protein
MGPKNKKKAAGAVQIDDDDFEAILAAEAAQHADADAAVLREKEMEAIKAEEAEEDDGDDDNDVGNKVSSWFWI